LVLATGACPLSAGLALRLVISLITTMRHLA